MEDSTNGSKDEAICSAPKNASLPNPEVAQNINNNVDATMAEEADPALIELKNAEEH